MRIITEDNIDQLTSMNYAKTIQNLKLTKLSRKEEEDYNKKYEGISSKEKLKTTKQIIEEEAKPEIIDLAEKGPLEEDTTLTKEEEDENDNEGLSQVTIESIKRAEDEFSRYQDLDEDENESIKIGEVVNNDELGIEELNIEKNNTPKQEQSNINSETTNINNETEKLEKEPVLLENITSITPSPSSEKKLNNEKSENMKTIVIKDQ